MLSKLLVRGARQLLTLQGPQGPRRGAHLRNIGLIADGAVLVSNGLITAVGPSRRVENLAEARFAHEISASGRVVMPGFVDSYVNPFRLPPKGVKASAGWPEQQARRLVRSCVAHGTTTLEAKVALDLQEAAQLRTLRLIGGLQEAASIFSALVLSRPVGGFSDRPETIQDKLVPLLTRARGRNLSDCIEVVCDSNHFQIAEAKAILDASHKLAFRRKLYASEGGNGCVAMAAACGVACVEGLNNATESDARALADGQTIATVFPSDKHIGMRTPAPARMLADHGVPICVATGANRNSRSTFSMQAAISDAVHELHLTEEEAISAATINGAYAAGRGKQIGSIEFGKDADLLLLDTSDYRDLTQYYGVNLAGMCIKKGEVVYRRQELSWP